MAVMTREARAIGSGVPNEYVQAMEGVGELDAFAAVVYSSNFEIEGQDIQDELLAGSVDGSRTLEQMSVEEAEASLRASRGAGIVDRASSVVDAAWVGFENVWTKVVGGGGAGGPIVG